MTDQELKIRENRLRRMANRQDLQLIKSRTRDPRATDFGRYKLTDAPWSRPPSRAFGLDDRGRATATLDEIEGYLMGRETHRERAEGRLRTLASNRGMHLARNYPLPGQDGDPGYTVMHGGRVAFAGALDEIEAYLAR